ncbi:MULTISPECIES: hypothetical protein [Cyanophyceae]|uniref:hypothetical protein n=1 Tax=Cyanophyceae TaxID=3028117 RepID=UPI001684BA58|nr:MULTISPECIES: hypothetical protein [Cyanophyceae]MBD1917252.1 hypothetical protein [Phormidium sp. FACHB-77]MBD2029496.1 hypothetical protein [Phormidium sp. FACHB-322]MBD2049881.1 hypothetical protein [Leptolyngbya sp. FACHB-60]
MVKDLLTLYEPINTLKLIADGIWIVDGPIVKMAMYGTAIPFTTRMTVVRLDNGGLWCHSPIELTPTLKAEIDADPNGKAPLDLRMTFWGRKAQARKGYEQMLAWAPEKIILAHGRWFPENGLAELERAFQWLK